DNGTGCRIHDKPDVCFEAADFYVEAMRLFSLEADSGNAPAMYDLGRMWADGLGVEADPDTAQEWYRKALASFLSAEKKLPERKKTYLQYRIGKMYLAGLGCTQDHKTAADWLERAAGKQHKYAQYSLPLEREKQ
ncbi:sel1 repeat family protein, partial [bacterium 1XD8-76]